MSETPVLVVEDDADGQAVVAHILHYLGVAVDTADTAEFAEHLLYDEGRRYRAIIIDLHLPGKDGWDLLRTLHTHADTAGVPCIAVTAYHDGNMADLAADAGFEAFFPKPINAEGFAEAVRELLG